MADNNINGKVQVKSLLEAVGYFVAKKLNTSPGGGGGLFDSKVYVSNKVGNAKSVYNGTSDLAEGETADTIESAVRDMLTSVSSAKIESIHIIGANNTIVDGDYEVGVEVKAYGLMATYANSGTVTPTDITFYDENGAVCGTVTSFTNKTAYLTFSEPKSFRGLRTLNRVDTSDPAKKEFGAVLHYNNNIDENKASDKATAAFTWCKNTVFYGFVKADSQFGQQATANGVTENGILTLRSSDGSQYQAIATKTVVMTKNENMHTSVVMPNHDMFNSEPALSHVNDSYFCVLVVPNYFQWGNDVTMRTPSGSYESFPAAQKCMSEPMVVQKWKNDTSRPAVEQSVSEYYNVIVFGSWQAGKGQSVFFGFHQ